MPCTSSDPPAVVTHEEEHTVTVTWEPFCADAGRIGPQIGLGVVRLPDT
jgi:hypothetical protein